MYKIPTIILVFVSLTSAAIVDLKVNDTSAAITGPGSINASLFRTNNNIQTRTLVLDAFSSQTTWSSTTADFSLSGGLFVDELSARFTLSVGVSNTIDGAIFFLDNSSSFVTTLVAPTPTTHQILSLPNISGDLVATVESISADGEFAIWKGTGRNLLKRSAALYSSELQQYFSVSGSSALRMLSLDGNHLEYSIGDVDAVGNGTILTINDNFQTVFIQANQGIVLSGPLLNLNMVRLAGLTVSALLSGPAIEGDTAYVTDALNPAYLQPVVGGGTKKVPVFFDGTNWVSH